MVPRSTMTKIHPIWFWGYGDQLPTFDAESKSAKILDAESKSAKIPKSLYKGGGGGREPTFTFCAESKYAKILKIFLVEVLPKIFYVFWAKSIHCQGVHLDYYMAHVDYVYAGP